jgi:hypothetical protein
MSGPPTGPAKQLTEGDKQYLRNHHRERIQDAREKAILCREQYDEQRGRGEIGDELYVDLVTATIAYWRQTRASVEDTRYEEEYPDFDEVAGLFERVAETDAPVYEIDDLDPKTFAAYIDAIDAVVVKSGLLEKER